MSVLIKGGTVVTATDQYKGDVLIEGEKVSVIGSSLSMQADRVIDATGKTNILLVSTGEKRQGVIGLFQPGLPGEQSPGLSVRFMGIERNAIAQYLIALYCSLVILTPDALGVLTDVDVNRYQDYP